LNKEEKVNDKEEVKEREELKPKEIKPTFHHAGKLHE
jgi:hypothetical protein